MFTELLLSAKDCFRLLVGCKEEKTLVLALEQVTMSFNELSSLA